MNDENDIMGNAMKAKDTITFYDGIVPAWIKSITYRLSKTGRSVVIDINGAMDLRSQMPGGHKRVYVTAIEFDLNPEGTIKSVMHGALSVQHRFYASCAVHDAREALNDDELVVLAQKIKDAGLKVYNGPEATGMIRAEIRRITDERKSMATSMQ
jgi:hypothetical protein